MASVDDRKVIELQLQTDSEAFRKVGEQFAKLASRAILADDAFSGLTEEGNRLKNTFDNIAIGNELDDLARLAYTDAQAVDVLIQRMAELGATQDELNRVALAMRDIHKNAELASQGVGSAATSIDRFKLEQRKADDYNSQVRRDVGIVGDADTGAQTIRGFLEYFGGNNAATKAVGGVGEIFAAIEGAAQLGAASKGLKVQLISAAQAIGVSGGGLIAGLVVLAVAFKALNDQFNNTKEAVAAQLETDRTRIEAIINLSKDEIEVRQQAAQEKIALEQAVLDNLKNTKREVDAALKDDDVLGTPVAQALIGVGQSLGVIGGELDALDDKISEAEKNLNAAQSEYNAYTAALNDSSVAAKEAAEAERVLADERQQVARRLADIGVEYLKLSQTNLDSSDIDNRIADLQGERDAIVTALSDVALYAGLGADGVAELEARLVDIDYELKLTNTVLTKSAQATDARRQAEEKLLAVEESRLASIDANVAKQLRYNELVSGASLDGVLDAGQALQNQRAALASQIPQLELLARTSDAAKDKLAEFRSQIAGIDSQIKENDLVALPAALNNAIQATRAEIAQLEADAANEIAGINAKLKDELTAIGTELSKALTDASRTRFTGLAKAQTDYTEALASNFTKFQSETVKLEKETLKQREKIIKDGARSLRSAIANRDALAAYEARRGAQAQLDDLNDSTKERQEQIKASYQEQIASIEESLAKQRAEVEAQYNEQVRVAKEKAREQTDVARQQAREQIAAVQNQLAEETNVRRQALSAQINELATFYSQGSSYMNQFVSSALTGMASLVSNVNFQLSQLQVPNFSAAYTNNFTANFQNATGQTPQQLADDVNRAVDERVGTLLDVFTF